MLLEEVIEQPFLGQVFIEAARNAMAKVPSPEGFAPRHLCAAGGVSRYSASAAGRQS
jgi:hypothetical protein